MSTRSLLKFGVLLVVLLLMATVSTFAQLATVYVDVTSGSNTYTGANATNSPAGTGPKATIAGGLGALANNGTLVIFAGIYNGGNDADADVNINSGTYPSLTSGLTIELRQLNGNNEVRLARAGGGGAGVDASFIFNITSGFLNIRTTSGTEYLNMTSASGNLTLTAGTVDISTASSFRLRSGATITINGTAAFTTSAPQKGTNLSLTYTGGSSINAGLEGNYGSYGTGIVTVSKTSGTSVTFSNALTFAGDNAGIDHIVVSSGNAVFNGSITIGSAGTSGGGAASQTAGDIVVSGTSSATFNSSVTLFANSQGTTDAYIGNVSNSGTGAVTFNGAVQWNSGYNAPGTVTFATGAGTGLVYNSSTGSITFNSSATLSTATTTASGAATNYVVTVENAGGSGSSVNFALPITAASTTVTLNAVVFVVNATNSSAGTLNIGGTLAGTLTNSSTGTATINNASTIGAGAVNSSTGILNFNAATAITGVLTNSSTGTVNVNAGTSATGVFTNGNGVAGTVVLGANTLTLSGSAAHLTNAGTVTATTGGIAITASGASSFNGGTLSNLSITGSGTNTLGTNAVSLASVTMSSGGLTAAIGTTVSGTTSLSGGTLTINDGVTYRTTGFTESGTAAVTLGGGASGILRVDGDFNRTGGGFTSAAGSTLSFQGSTAQAVNGGVLLQAVNLTFNNSTGATITLGQSVRVSGTCTISASNTLDLGTLNIILNGASATIVNNGTYTASGGGGVIFGGLNTVSGGAAYASQKIEGTGTYSYLTIDVGSANVVTADLTQNLKWNGVLTLRSGDLKIGSAPGGVSTTTDFAPTGTTASVIRYLSTTGTASTSGITLQAASGGGGVGTFNGNVPTDYDLTYTGSLGGNVNVTAGSSEFSTGRVRNLTVSTTTSTLTLLSAGAITIKGNLTLSSSALFVLDGGTPYNTTVQGNLSVGSSAVLSGGNAANTITLSAASGAHSVVGTITNASILTVTGASATLSGSTTTGTVAEIANLSAGANAGVTVTNIQRINGALTTGSASTLTLTFAAPDGGDAIVGGAITLGGTSFTLGSAFTQTAGAFAHNTGSVNFGSFNLTVSSAGGYTRAAAASAVYTSTTGYLVFGSSLTANFNAGSIPRLRVSGGTTTTLGASVTVSDILDITGAGSTITSGGFSVTLNNSCTTVGGTIFTGTGAIVLAGATVTASGDATISNLTVNGTAGTTAGTLQTSDLTTPTARTFTITGVLTQTAGDLATGINTVRLNGTGTVLTRGTSAGSITQTTGVLAFQPVADNAQTFTPGTSWSVTNLTVNFDGAVVTTGGNRTLTSTTPTVAFTVTGTLTLTAGTLTTNAGTLTLGTGATIVRSSAGGAAGALSSVPTFGTSVNISYTVASVTTGAELPTSTTVLNNLTSNPGGGNTVTLGANCTVNGTIFLTTGTLDRTSGFTLTLAAGGTINRSSGIFFAGRPPTATTYNLVYSAGGAVTTTSDEFLASPATLLGVTVQTTSTVVTLHADRTVTNLTLSASSGGIALNAGGGATPRKLTVTGNLTVTAGNFSTVAIGGAGSTTIPTVAFAGTAPQTITVPAAGLTLPNAADGSVPADLDFVDAGDTPPIDIQINNTASTDANKSVTLLGGNFTMGRAGTLQLTSGVVYTGTLWSGTAGGSNYVWTLALGSDANNQPTQGFARAAALPSSTNPTGTGFSHVVGNVKKFIDRTNTVAISVVSFPVGTAPSSPGNYRQMNIFFKTAPQSSINLTVSHVNSNPGGANGFPLSATPPITNYPAFYWFVQSDISLAPSYLFDMEAQAQGYTDYDPSTIQNIRYVRRDSGSVSNQWVQQAAAGGYQNSTIAPSWPAVKVVDAQGGITSQGSIYTYSQSNKPPVFSASLGNVTANEGTTVAGTYTAGDPDLNQTVTLSAVALPAGATFNATTGAFSWAVDYTKGPGTYTVTIRATDNSGASNNTKDTTNTITVVNVNRAPSFTATGAAVLTNRTISDGQALTFTYVAADSDVGDRVTYTLTAGPTGAALTAAGVLTWTPTFAQAGSSYTITVTATDTTGTTATTSASVTVGRSVRRGDANLNGVVTASDAAVILQYTVGLFIPTDSARFAYAADASANGTITAFDASKVLLFVVDSSANPLPSSAREVSEGGSVLSKTAVGSIEWGKARAGEQGDVLQLPMVLSSGSSDIYSIEISMKIPAGVELKAVATNLPDGWIMEKNIDKGELRVAMAGAAPMSGREFGVMTFKLVDKEIRFSPTANVSLNENLSSTIAAQAVAAVPTEFGLSQNYPNPFNPSTRIKYQLPANAKVVLDIYNIAGQKVRTLVNDEQEAGYYSVEWNGQDGTGQRLASGVYLYRIQAGSHVQINKMVMLK